MLISSNPAGLISPSLFLRYSLGFHRIYGCPHRTWPTSQVFTCHSQEIGFTPLTQLVSVRDISGLTHQLLPNLHVLTWLPHGLITTVLSIRYLHRIHKRYGQSPRSILAIQRRYGWSQKNCPVLSYTYLTSIGDNADLKTTGLSIRYLRSNCMIYGQSPRSIRAIHRR